MNYNLYPIQEMQLEATNIHIGGCLKARRKELNLTQQGLANAMGVSYQQIQKYENGTNKISADRLFFISILLGVDLSYFFSFNHELKTQVKATNQTDFCANEIDQLIKMDCVNPAVRTALVNLIETMNNPEGS